MRDKSDDLVEEVLAPTADGGDDLPAVSDQSETVYDAEEYAAYIEERKIHIDAAKDAAKTFDQAALAFGTAVFGASVAFIKDVAPHPDPHSLRWLATAWGCFAAGLLAIMESFQSSHRASMTEIELIERRLMKLDDKTPKNKWAIWTGVLNYGSMALFFIGLILWAVFA